MKGADEAGGKVEDEVMRLRREKEEAAAEAQRVKAELEKAWEEMREAWEVREEDEEHLRQLLARLEARNADLELRDRELRGDLSRLSDAETSLAHSLLLHKLVYKAFHKGFLNDEEEEDDDPPGSTAASRLHPDLVTRRQELNEIDSFVQRKRHERQAKDKTAGGDMPSVASSPAISSYSSSSTTSSASSLTLSLSSEDPAGAFAAGTPAITPTSSSEITTEVGEEQASAGSEANIRPEVATAPVSTPTATAAAGGGGALARSAVAGAAQGAADHVRQGPPLNTSSGGLGGAGGPKPALKREGGSGVKGRVTIAEVVNPMSALKSNLPPPRSPMKKPDETKASKLPPTHHGQSGHGHGHGHGHVHHGQHGHHQHPVKHHPTTLQDLFVAAATPAAPASPKPRAKGEAQPQLQLPLHGSPRGHSRSRSMGGPLVGMPAPDPTSAAAPMSARGVPKPPMPPPPPPLVISVPGDVKKSKIEREIDEYCGEGLNEHEDEDEKVPVATHRLLIKLREENFFVPTANRAFIKTCNTFLVNILKAISSCVKMCKRDLKAQAFWLSYTTSFLHLLKQETKGKLEGMRQIRDPRKNGIQLMSANKLIRKVTSMPETSTEYIILSRRIEICGFSCKLLQITQRVYSNLLKIITKQLEPLLVPVVFYHSRTAPSPFVSAHAHSTSLSNLPAYAAPLASPRGGSSPMRSASAVAVPALSLAPPGSNRAHAAAGAGLPRSTSTPTFLSGLALPTSAHIDYSCTKNGNDILLVLSKMFYNLMSNNVYCTIVQQFFTQTYHVMDAALFNHLIDNARHLATVANALAVKSMLSQLTSWRRRVNLVHRKSKQFAHIREAVNVLSISKAMFLEVDTAQAFSHLNDLQILHLLVCFQPDDLAPEPVPGKVKHKLQERSQQHSKDLSLHIDPTLMFTYKRKKPDTRHHSK